MGSTHESFSVGATVVTRDRVSGDIHTFTFTDDDTAALCVAVMHEEDKS